MQFTYNPSTGEAEQTSGGIPVDAPLGSDQATQEIADAKGQSILDETAAYLSGKHKNHAAQFGNSGNYELELQLADIQSKLSRGNFRNNIEETMMIQQAEQIAAQLVGGAYVPNPTDDEPVDHLTDEEAVNENIRNNYDTEAILANAAEVMDEDRVNRWNDLLGDSSDEQTKTAAIETLSQLKSNPQYFTEAGNTPLGQDAIQQCIEAYGQDTAAAIQTLSNVVASGQVSPTAALKTASKNPQLLQALLDGARRGFFKLGL